MLKKGILNIKINGNFKKSKQVYKNRGLSIQNTLDQYVTKPACKPRKTRSKLKTFIDSDQTTLDRFISKLKITHKTH